MLPQDHKLGRGRIKSTCEQCKQVFGNDAYQSWKSGIRGEDNHFTGGLGETVGGEVSNRISGKIHDPSGLNRFSGFLLRGKQSTMVGILHLYAPVFGGAVEARETGMDTSTGIVEDKRDSIWDDIAQVWEVWHLKGAHLIFDG